VRWPHEREFRGRAILFWTLSLLAVARTSSVPGVSDRAVVLGTVGAAVASLIVYGYTLVLGRLDARFRHFRPRKFRYVTISGFYLFVGLACGLLVGAPWLMALDRRKTPSGLIVYYLAVPCLLAAAAGAYRVVDQYRLAEPPGEDR
jgi:short subunit fatty acids transporter